MRQAPAGWRRPAWGRWPQRRRSHLRPHSRACFGEVELDVPGFLPGARLVEACARDEGGDSRTVARAPASGLRGDLHGRLGDLDLGRRRPDLRMERFQHPRGVLAARHTKIESLLGPRENRVGVVGAVVAALTAVLLAHRGHHAPAKRPAVGELHALGERQSQIVPGHVAVVAGRADRIELHAREESCRILWRQGGRVAFQQPGEKPVEPLPLLEGKRRVVGNDGGERHPQGRVHDAPSSNMVRSASMSWRRENFWNVSSGEARPARYPLSMRSTVRDASSAFTFR